MKIAIVHDWLTTFAGSERVVRELMRMYPHADLYSTIDFLSDADREAFGGHRARTTFAQRLPGVCRHYQKYLPLLMLAVEQIDVSGYDLVISSSHAVAKGVITGPDQVHVSYVHSPMRYAWDLQHQYLKEAGLERGPKSMIARAMLHYARIWDTRTANGVDHFIANSNYIARRIRKVYGREATVVHPPVDVQGFALETRKEPYFVAVSRMVPYKRVGAIVDAFAHLPGYRLRVVGDGPDMAAIRARCPSNVDLLGQVSQPHLQELMQRASALVFAAEEDFGITLVESLAAGTPLIALGRGGVLDIVGQQSLHDPVAFLFEEATPKSIADAVTAFLADRHLIKAESCRKAAMRFTPSRFSESMRSVVKSALEKAAETYVRNG